MEIIANSDVSIDDDSNRSGMGSECAQSNNIRTSSGNTHDLEVMHFSKCVLYPPDEDVCPPSSEKILGCSTVFVNGLPQNATEEIIKEVFEHCGKVSSVRMTKMNSCYITFSSEVSVDAAVGFSGCQIKIGNDGNAPNTGRLNVDFSHDRDDHHHHFLRKVQCCEMLEQEFHRTHTPPPIPNYSDSEAASLEKKICSEETFQHAILILMAWLERGECSERNASYFYSMIQNITDHVQMLTQEKLKCEEKFNKSKVLFKQQMLDILMQFNEIGRILKAASTHEVLGYFTTRERENIELWKKQTEAVKKSHVEELLGDCIEDEMHVSDGECDTFPKSNSSCASVSHHAIDSVTNSNIEEQQALVSGNSDNKEGRDQPPLKVTKWGIKDGELGEHISCQKEDNSSCIKDISDAEVQEGSGAVTTHGTKSSSDLIVITQVEAYLVALISTFLNIHPFGADLDRICSFLQHSNCKVHVKDVEALLKKFPSVFKEESTGLGENLEKKWTFSATNSPI